MCLRISKYQFLNETLSSLLSLPPSLSISLPQYLFGTRVNRYRICTALLSLGLSFIIINQKDTHTHTPHTHTSPCLVDLYTHIHNKEEREWALVNSHHHFFLLLLHTHSSFIHHQSSSSSSSIIFHHPFLRNKVSDPPRLTYKLMYVCIHFPTNQRSDILETGKVCSVRKRIQYYQTPQRTNTHVIKKWCLRVHKVSMMNGGISF